MEDKVQINGILMVYKALCQHPVLKRGEKEKKREGKERKEGEEQEEQGEKKIKERNEINQRRCSSKAFSLTASSNNSYVRCLISHLLHLLGKHLYSV